MALSAKTLAERKAGRDAIQLAVADAVLREEMDKLRGRFPSVMASPHLNWNKDSHEDEWTVEIAVKTRDGIIAVTDKFSGFPNDELVATLMLIDG